MGRVIDGLNEREGEAGGYLVPAEVVARIERRDRKEMKRRKDKMMRKKGRGIGIVTKGR